MARIVKHVMPGNNDIGLDANIDKTTANWLSQSYTTGEKKAQTKDHHAYDEEAEKLRLQTLESSQAVVSRCLSLLHVNGCI